MAFTLTSDVAKTSQFNGTGTASITVTLPTCNAGDFIRVWVTMGTNPNTNTITVSDPTNGAYTAGQKLYQALAGQGSQQFLFKNSAANPGVITASYNAGTPYTGMYAEAWGGCDTTTGIDPGKEQGQIQVAPGTGANAIVSNATGPTPTQTDLFLGSCMDHNVVTSTQVVGTNVAWGTNTNGNQTAGLATRFENFTSGSALAATYTDATNGAAHDYATMVMAVLPAASGPSAGTDTATAGLTESLNTVSVTLSIQESG